MITSTLKKDVQYIITNSINKTDLDKEAYVYTAKIYNKHIKFVLGVPNFEYLSSGIMYFNIYLVNNGSIVSKIGVYETNNIEYSSLLDYNGDVDLNKMIEPIIFPFAKSLIMNNYDLVDEFETMSNVSESSNESIDSLDTSDIDDSESTKSETFNKPNSSYNLMAIISQTKEESDYEISNYEEDPRDSWVGKYLRSNKYEIIDNEGGGDCFFAVLRDALKSVKIETSVKSIREKLANELDENIFQTYKELFDLYYNNMKKTQEQL